jgi:hypothetical protein
MAASLKNDASQGRYPVGQLAFVFGLFGHTKELHYCTGNGIFEKIRAENRMNSDEVRNPASMIYD